MAGDKLLSNVAAKDWWKYSIEFCRSTHEIKDLIVLGESRIAKGIGRIVAITGHDAMEARRIASNFEEERLAKLETELSISTLTKKAFTKRFENIAKDLLKEPKRSKNRFQCGCKVKRRASGYQASHVMYTPYTLKHSLGCLCTFEPSQ
jgi:alanyl-tRNA synthetase